ncbi:MAG: hypothetical protein IJH86_04725, partial [Clostridia bacterium]|nr:hypothetical protein [Clostridia bacterium]
MLKRSLSLMLALCLLATASSVAFMEENLEENAFEAVQITSDPVDQTVTDGEQELDDLDEIASDSVITDAVPADEDVTVVDDVPVVDETPAADEAPATDEPPADDETPAADEAPVADAVVAADETSAADEAVAAEASPAAAEAEP